MSGLTDTLAPYAADPADIPGAVAEIMCAPSDLDEAATILAACSEAGASVVLWGGGTHQGIGGAVPADVVLSTHRLNRIVDWQPDNLTVVAEAGVTASDLHARLNERNQTAVLPETPGVATVGGLVATGASMFRRARYGPIRDRMLEATLVTGDGRIVRGGGQLVKNVTGFDIPRLAAGSLGSLGLVGQVCLKLWPVASSHATVRVDDPQRALVDAYRPLAILERNGVSHVYLGGTPQEVAGQAAQLGEIVSDQTEWPEPFAVSGNEVLCSIRIPPSDLVSMVERLPSGWDYVAAHGVGELTVKAPSVQLDNLFGLREAAEARRGALVLLDGPSDVYEKFDPWGTPPPSVDLQRRVIARFDPDRVINRGRLPGGL